MATRASWLGVLAWVATASPGLAHPVPTLVVETVFGKDRSCEFRVNLDPRLFLSPQPTSLPPIPASWWLEQDTPSKNERVLAAIAYVDRTLQFFFGTEKMAASWAIVPVDSVQATPLSPESAEVHLLASYRGLLPEKATAFKVSLSKDSAVAAILINSRQDQADRSPQSLFPGETSLSFALPEAPAVRPVISTPAGPARSSLRWGMAWFALGVTFAGFIVVRLLYRRTSPPHPKRGPNS